MTLNGNMRFLSGVHIFIDFIGFVVFMWGPIANGVIDQGVAKGLFKYYVTLGGVGGFSF